MRIEATARPRRINILRAKRRALPIAWWVEFEVFRVVTEQSPEEIERICKDTAQGPEPVAGVTLLVGSITPDVDARAGQNLSCKFETAPSSISSTTGLGIESSPRE